jgi:hypothetical protein
VVVVAVVVEDSVKISSAVVEVNVDVNEAVVVVIPVSVFVLNVVYEIDEVFARDDVSVEVVDKLVKSSVVVVSIEIEVVELTFVTVEVSSLVGEVELSPVIVEVEVSSLVEDEVSIVVVEDDVSIVDDSAVVVSILMLV